MMRRSTASPRNQFLGWWSYAVFYFVAPSARKGITMTSRELRQQAAQLISEARQLQDKADEEKRDLTAEEDANYDKYLEDALALKEKADKRDELERIEAEQAATVGLISDNDLPQNRTDSGPVETADEIEASYSRAFDDVIFYRGTSGPTQAAVANYEARALQADVDLTGGFTVAPPQFSADLIQAVDNVTFFPSLARVIPVTSSDSLGFVSLDTDVADPAWTAEIGSLSEDSSMAFGGRELNPNQLTKLVKVSNKVLMVSAVGIESLVRERLAYKFGVTEENVYLNGTGAGQPLGVFTASALGISTGRDVNTNNSTTSFTFDNLKEVKYSIKAQYWSRLNWIFHRDAVKLASKLKDGEGQYQWESSVVFGDPDRLLNFPVRVSEYAPSTFTTGLYVGILGDFSQYYIARLQGFGIQRLDELYAETSQVGFKSQSWLDGMPVLEEAFARVTLA